MVQCPQSKWRMKRSISWSFMQKTKKDGLNQNWRPHFLTSHISDERLLAVIAKVENYYEKEGLDDLVKRSILTHPVVEGAISADPSLGTSGLKHLKQNSSLLGHLEATGAMDPPFQSKAAIFEPFWGSETELFLFWNISCQFKSFYQYICRDMSKKPSQNAYKARGLTLQNTYYENSVHPLSLQTQCL